MPKCTCMQVRAYVCVCTRCCSFFSISHSLFCSGLFCSVLVFTSTIVCVVIFVQFHNCFKHSWDYCGSKGNRNHPLTITTCRQILFLLSFYSNMCLVCMHKCMFDLLFGITNNIPIERVSEWVSEREKCEINYYFRCFCCKRACVCVWVSVFSFSRFW